MSSQKSKTREKRFLHFRIVEVQIGLVRIKTVPVIGLGDGIPGPIGGLEVFENNPRLLIALLAVAPDVKFARAAARLGLARALKPGMLVGSVIDDQLGDHANAAPVRLAQKDSEILQRAVIGMDAGVVGDIVTVVAQRRGIKGQQPERRDAQVLEIIELFREPDKIADAVAVAVAKGAHVDLVDDRVLVPERVVVQDQRISEFSCV